MTGMQRRQVARWMRWGSVTLLVLAAALATEMAVAASAAGQVSAAQLEQNKRIVLGLTAAMAEKNVDKASAFLADGYIQHNPNVPTGKAGFIAFFTPRWAGQQQPAKPLENPPAEIVAEGNVVMLIFRHATPDPVDANQSYDAFTFDAYRVIDGKVAEHWDGGVRRAPAAPAPGSATPPAAPVAAPAPASAAPPAAATTPAGPPPKPAYTPDLKSSLALAEAAMSACKAKGYSVSVSVVDAAGQAKVTLGSDGSAGRTVTSVRKAATAAIFKAPGSQLEARARTDSELAAKLASPDYNDHPGSLPIEQQGKIIGGIGVTGAPTHEEDEACARAALGNAKVKIHGFAS